MEQALYSEMDRMEQDHWWFTGRRSVVCGLANRYQDRVKNGTARVCEVGCGTGGNLLAFSNQREILGIEPAESARKIANQKLDGQVVAGTLPHDLPAPPNRWDLVLMTDVLEHVEDDFASARSALDLLDEGGVLVATVPAYPWLYSPRDKHHHHFRRYTKKRFRQLFDHQDCQTRILSHYNTFLFPPAAAARLWSKWFPKPQEEQDLKLPPSVVNRGLHAMFSSERNLVRWTGLPFGLSLIALIERVSVEGATKESTTEQGMSDQIPGEAVHSDSNKTYSRRAG